MRYGLVAAILICLLHLPAMAQTIGRTPSGNNDKEYVPQIFGGIKTKLETSLYDGSSRFDIRNARVGVRGMVNGHMRYAAQVDLNNEGNLSVLDSYIAMAFGNLDLSFGQQQYGFSTDLDRGPTSNIFVNRSFISKFITTYYGETLSGGAPKSYVRTIGSRDIGAIARYKLGGAPLRLSLGAFNGSGINNSEWQDDMNVVGRIEVGRDKGLGLAASHYNGSTPVKTGVVPVDGGTFTETDISQQLVMWGGEVRYVGDKYRIESEYAQRRLKYNGMHILSAAHVQGYYRFDTERNDMLKYIAPIGRWDMGRDIEFMNKSGNMERFSAHRATAGVTFGFSSKMMTSEIRLQFEKYFLDEKPSDYNTNPLLQDKISVEFVAAF